MEELRKRIHVIFCVDHYNPLGVLRSLGEEGIKPVVILYSQHKPYLIPSSIYECKLHWVKTMEEGLIVLQKEYGSEDHPPFIYTCSDEIESFLDLHYDELKGRFHFFDGGSQGQITRVMEKNEMCRLAVECGLNIPKTEEVAVGKMPKSLRYPIMTKSVISTLYNWKGNVHICHNEEELHEAYKSIRGERIILQEFIEKKNELCLDGLSINGGEELYIPLQSEYIRFSPKSYGNYVYFEEYKEFELLEKLKRLFKKTHFSGIFSVEFLRDKYDNFYFLEINFRNSTWSYAYTREGINLPIIYAKSVLEGKLDTSFAKLKKRTFTAMDECADFKESVIGKKVGLWKWIKEVKACDCLFYGHPVDKKPRREFIKHRILSMFHLL